MIGVDIMSIKISINGAVLLNDNTMQQVTGTHERESKIEGSNEAIVSTLTGLDIKSFWGSVTQVAVTYTLDWSKIRAELGDKVKELVDSMPNASDFYRVGSGGNTSVTNGSKGGTYSDRAKNGYYDSYKISEDGKIIFGKLGQFSNTTTSDIVIQAIRNKSVEKPALISALKAQFKVGNIEDLLADNGIN